MDVLVPRTMEDDVGVVCSTPQERVQNLLLEPSTEFPCASVFGGARAESYVGADNGIPCASDIGGSHGIVPSSPQESVQNRVGEQIADSLVLLFM